MQLVTLMHGNIGLEERRSRTLFWFEVPLLAVEQPPVPAIPTVTPGSSIAESKASTQAVDVGSGVAPHPRQSLVVEEMDPVSRPPSGSGSPGSSKRIGSKRNLRVKTADRILFESIGNAPQVGSLNSMMFCICVDPMRELTTLVVDWLDRSHEVLLCTMHNCAPHTDI